VRKLLLFKWIEKKIQSKLRGTRDKQVNNFLTKFVKKIPSIVTSIFIGSKMKKRKNI